MKVTNTERMTQLGSAIKTYADVINRVLSDTALNTKLSKITDLTVSDALNNIMRISDTICGQGDDAKYYYADIELPFTENTFPVEHR